MNTTAAIFFLVLGQAPDGFHATGSSMVVMPSHYQSAAECAAAGEGAREANVGLAFLSYTCVEGQVNVDATPVRQRPTGNHATPTTVSFSSARVVKPAQMLGAKCDQVCELIEAAE